MPQKKQKKVAKLLDSDLGRAELPRYRRRSRKPKSRATVYAFHLRRSPHWVVIGKGWISNLSDADFVDTYRPSNKVARDLYALAEKRFSPEALQIQKYYDMWGDTIHVDNGHLEGVTQA